MGIASLILPHTGYLQTFPRLVALLGRSIPLYWSPTYFALVAFAVQWSVPAFFFSDRCANMVGSPLARFGFACLICAMPCPEVFVNLTNSQWQLAALDLLIVLSAAPRSGAAWTFDGVMLAVGATSGPFSVLLTPIAFWEFYTQRSRAAFARCLVLASGAVLQLASTFLDSTIHRVATPLDAAPARLARILAEQIVLLPGFGVEDMLHIAQTGLWRRGILPWLVVALVAMVCGFAWRRSASFRPAFVFGALIVTAAMISPVVSDKTPQWVVMDTAFAGQRYFFIPRLVWLAALGLVACHARWVPRMIARVFLASSIFIGFWREWNVPDDPDRGFYQQAIRYEKAAPGTRFSLPIRPDTYMILDKPPR